jgi:hypothetical protein
MLLYLSDIGGLPNLFKWQISCFYNLICPFLAYFPYFEKQKEAFEITLFLFYIAGLCSLKW